ncbi:hypothetical protein [Thalassobacillus sp. B23F22_16]|uniref:hypothetical protein n=1 Tax=Thalassobacillus sp. B23F22_16 TaxID=3459513 RepID=UPI00373F3281
MYYYYPYQPMTYPGHRQQNGGQGPMVCFPQDSAPQIEGGMEGTFTPSDGEELSVVCYPVPVQGAPGGPGQGNGQGNGNGGQEEIPYGEILEQLPQPGQGNGNGNGQGGMMPQLPFPGQGGNGQGGMPGFPAPGQGNGQGMPGGGMMPGLPGPGQGGMPGGGTMPGQQGNRFGRNSGMSGSYYYPNNSYYW